MAREFDLEVGGMTLRGKTAPATAQHEALHIAMRTSLVVMLSDPEGVSDMGAVATLGGIDYGDVTRLEELLVKGNVWRAEDDVPVAANLFADQIEAYYLMLFRVVSENLAGFWKLQRPEGGQAVEQATS